MPGVDNCEPQVIHALENAGWQIIKSQKAFHTDERLIYVDVLAERASNGTVRGRKTPRSHRTYSKRRMIGG